MDKWRGQLNDGEHLVSLFGIALDSDDLRVRAAANSRTRRVLANETRRDALWYIGNRGVDPHRAFEIVSASVEDRGEFVRSAAVNGLAYLGTDETIVTLLEIFHNGSNPGIREQAACGLAQSGMLSEKQRRTVVPKLLDFAEDPALDSKTREWVFQALRDIRGQNLPHDAAIWRNWYNGGHLQWSPITRDNE